MNSFSGSITLWNILGDYEPFNVHRWQCKGPFSGSYGPKIGQNCMKYDILGTFRAFLLQKRQELINFLVVLFYGVLGEYLPFKVLRWQCKGPLSGSYGHKIGRNCMKYDILGTFRAFVLEKDRNESIFWQYYFMEYFGRT